VRIGREHPAREDDAPVRPALTPGIPLQGSPAPEHGTRRVSSEDGSPSAADNLFDGTTVAHRIDAVADPPELAGGGLPLKGPVALRVASREDQITVRRSHLTPPGGGSPVAYIDIITSCVV
jgi:hypothetical protein